MKLEEIWLIATPISKLWLDRADGLFGGQLKDYELEAIEYLQHRGGDPRSDCSEWAGSKPDGFQSGVDIADNLRSRLVFDLRRRLAEGEFRAFGKVMLSDATTALREIPAAAFSAFNSPDRLQFTPNDMIGDFIRSTVYALGHHYFEVRAMEAAEINRREEKRKRGGRNPAIPGLEDYARMLAKADPAFPGENQSEDARRLREFVKTQKGVLSNTEMLADDRTFKRAIERAFSKLDKT